MSVSPKAWRESERPGPPRCVRLEWCTPAFAEACERLGLGDVEGAFACGAGEELVKPGLGHRSRTRLALPAECAAEGDCLYLKRYGPEPLSWRLRRRWATGRAIGPARAELENARSLAEAGVPAVPEGLAAEEYDAAGRRVRSFVALAEVPGRSLEAGAEDWLTGDDATGRGERLADALADLVGSMHAAGFVHRDLYACHVFFRPDLADLGLRLIDLARVFRPRLRRFRWFVKDLAQLRYSMPPRWTERQWERFLAGYVARRGQAAAGWPWTRAVHAKAARIARRDARKAGRAEKGEPS